MSKVVALNFSQDVHEKAVQVLDFLNAKAKKRFRVATPKGEVTAQFKFIMARLDDGYEIQDMKAIVANRVRAWGDDKRMREFLRPQTLFGPESIEKYLGEIGE